MIDNYIKTLPKGFKTWLEFYDLVKEAVIVDKIMGYRTFGEENVEYEANYILAKVAEELLENRPNIQDVYALEMFTVTSHSREVHDIIKKLYKIASNA